jgi:hypothetical protein
MEHIYEEHTKIDLECWGLNRDLLGKFVKAEDDKVHLKKRMKKFNSQNTAEVQDQVTLKSNADILLHAQEQLIFCRKL